MDRDYCLFTRTEADQPRLISSNAVLGVSRSDYPFLTLVPIPYAATPNGLPKQGELQRTGKIQDKIIAQFDPSQFLLLGHSVGEGKRTAVFHSRIEAPETITVKLAFWRTLSITPERRHDPSWNWFDTHMTPTDLEREIARNDQLCRQLQSLGDKPSIPRLVDFTAHFPTETARDAFAESIKAHGIVIASTNQWVDQNDTKPQYWIELQVSTTVEPSTISQKSLRFRESAAALEGEFDGWGCPLTR